MPQEKRGNRARRIGKNFERIGQNGSNRNAFQANNEAQTNTNMYLANFPPTTKLLTKLLVTNQLY